MCGEGHSGPSPGTQPTPWVCAASVGTSRRPRAVARRAQGRAATWTVCFPLVLSPEFLDFSFASPSPATHPASSTLCHQLLNLLTSRCYEPRPSFPPLARRTAALVLGPWLPPSEASRLWGHGRTCLSLQTCSRPPIPSRWQGVHRPREVSPLPLPLIRTPSPSRASLVRCSLLPDVVTGALVTSAGGCPRASIPPRASLLPVV